MARIIKEYDERYTEFLDVAQKLFYSKGYEQSSVQGIIKAVNVAKGTFYGYRWRQSYALPAAQTRDTSGAKHDSGGRAGASAAA